MKYAKIILSLLAIPLLHACMALYPDTPATTGDPARLSISVPMAGNAWVMTNGQFGPSDIITDQGVRNWTRPQQTVRTFFHVARAGQVSLGIRARGKGGISKLRCQFGTNAQEISLEGSGLQDIFIGTLTADRPGYYYLDLTGLEKSGSVYAEVDALLLGSSHPGAIQYVKNDFYFARRGPSVHLFFDIPTGVDNIEWFYSQLTVPAQQDVLGSYFMANGFGEGYFGIQVNSPTERKILFSIWSPFQTDNPADIPEASRVRLLKKGPGVTVGEFGNEGSGGQSFKSYPWKTGVSYGFLVGAKPAAGGSTDYVAYFHDPETGTWSLIAAFRRPQTQTYLKGLYSFLENFYPDQGVHARQGLYENQWVYDAAGWHELTGATFSADNTARKGYRLDYTGGVQNQRFYLKNCGFFHNQIAIDSKLARARSGRGAPNINFAALP